MGDTGNTAHSRDAAFIVGDNGNVFRLVDAAGNDRTFTYDNYGGPLRLIPRSVQQLDYTLGGNAVGFRRVRGFNLSCRWMSIFGFLLSCLLTVFCWSLVLI